MQQSAPARSGGDITTASHHPRAAGPSRQSRGATSAVGLTPLLFLGKLRSGDEFGSDCILSHAVVSLGPRPALFRLDVARPDHLAPLLRFVGDKFAKIPWRPRDDGATKISKPCLHFGVGEGQVDFAI